MLSQFQDALNVYLFPFMIAIPIALVLYLLATRRDDTPPPPAEPAPREPDRVRATSAAPAGPTVTARRTVAQPPAADPVAPSSQVPPAWAAATQPPTWAPTEQAPALTADLLLVDDSAVARAKLRKLFESAGYTTDLARDGLEAVELLGKGRYALMITDLEMPNMNGVELIAAASGSLETENMPILAITGHDDLQAKVHECQGLFGIFKKPWNDRELLRRVETLVRVQRASLDGTASH